MKSQHISIGSQNIVRQESEMDLVSLNSVSQSTLLKETKVQNKRYYYLDWLRVLAFALLFLFHSWRPFDHHPWHIKNIDQSIVFDLLTNFTHGWRMFLIFLISGAGTFLAMRSRKDAFVLDRVKRLIVPFLFGISLIIPPQRFYEWILFNDFQGTYFDFLAMYLSMQLCDTLGTSLLLWFGHLGTHIWYLPFLFVMTLFVLPLLKRIQKGQVDFTPLKRLMSSKFGVFALAIPMILSRFVLKPIFSEYTDWADFFVYIWPFLYGFIFMTDLDFIEVLKKKMSMLLNVGILSSTVFMYLLAQGESLVQAYLHPSFSFEHLMLCAISATIALSWILFFLGFFAKKMDFNHRLLIPANISILPIYVLHQTLIIVFGFYINRLEINLFLKFLMIAGTAIPASIVIYKLVQSNNPMRFLFGLKPRNAKNDRADQRPFQKIISKDKVVHRYTPEGSNNCSISV